MDCLIPDEACRPFKSCRCQYCDHECDPVIVLPSAQKQLDVFPEIARMWREAFSALSDASSLLVFGFSFPTTDELFIDLMRGAIFKFRRMKKIVVVDVTPDAVIDRIQSALNGSHAIEYIPLKVSTDGMTPQWFIDPKVEQRKRAKRLIAQRTQE